MQRLAGCDEAGQRAELEGCALEVVGDDGEAPLVSYLNERGGRQHPQERGLAVGGGPHG